MTRDSASRTLLLAVLLFCPLPALLAEGWGELKVQVLFSRDAPAYPPLVGPGDPVHDAKLITAPIPDESLVIDAETKGVANVFVWLRSPKSMHPDFEEAAKRDVEVRARQFRYVPRAVVLRSGQVLRVQNDLGVAHNVHSYPQRNRGHNEVIPAGQDLFGAFVFHKPESLPVVIKSDVHPWMRLYCLPLDHPYGGVTDAKGVVTLKNVPAGTHRLYVWHEKAGFLTQHKVSVESDRTTDLGPLLYQPKQFRANPFRVERRTR